MSLAHLEASRWCQKSFQQTVESFFTVDLWTQNSCTRRSYRWQNCTSQFNLRWGWAKIRYFLHHKVVWMGCKILNHFSRHSLVKAGNQPCIKVVCPDLVAVLKLRVDLVIQESNEVSSRKMFWRIFSYCKMVRLRVRQEEPETNLQLWKISVKNRQLETHFLTRPWKLILINLSRRSLEALRIDPYTRIQPVHSAPKNDTRYGTKKSQNSTIQLFRSVHWCPKHSAIFQNLNSTDLKLILRSSFWAAKSSRTQIARHFLAKSVDRSHPIFTWQKSSTSHLKNTITKLTILSWVSRSKN